MVGSLALETREGHTLLVGLSLMCPRPTCILACVYVTGKYKPDGNR